MKIEKNVLQEVSISDINETSIFNITDGEKESSDGLNISESLDNLKQVEVETYNNFPTQLKRGCKLKVYN